MKVLILSGEVTHQRPISYGLPQDWEVSVLSLVDAEYLALCEKYEDPSNISFLETLAFLKAAYEKTVNHLKDVEIDAIVGIGYGAHILMNLNTSYEWRGPSVFVFSEGTTKYNFVSQPLLDEIDYDVRPVMTSCITVLNESHKQKITTSSKKWSHEKNAVLSVYLRNSDWMTNLYTSGLLRICLNALNQS